jgi:hypothetical protein
VPNHKLEELRILAIELPKVCALIDWLLVYKLGHVASVSVCTVPVRFSFAIILLIIPVLCFFPWMVLALVSIAFVIFPFYKVN